jgi:hypothetical protein
MDPQQCFLSPFINTKPEVKKEGVSVVVLATDVAVTPIITTINDTGTVSNTVLKQCLICFEMPRTGTGT